MLYKNSPGQLKFARIADHIAGNQPMARVLRVISGTLCILCGLIVLIGLPAHFSFLSFMGSGSASFDWFVGGALVFVLGAFILFRFEGAMLDNDRNVVKTWKWTFFSFTSDSSPLNTCTAVEVRVKRREEEHEVMEMLYELVLKSPGPDIRIDQLDQLQPALDRANMISQWSGLKVKDSTH